MAKSKVKKAIKLPDVLICLGRAVSVTGVEMLFKWPIKAKCQLYCSTSGESLYCLVSTAKESSKDEFNSAVGKHQKQVDTAVKLYERWHDFDPVSGSIVRPPRGFLFDVDRAESIIYSSDKWVGRTRSYIHTFKTPPKVWVNRKTDPTLLVMTGGRIRVTKEGITG